MYEYNPVREAEDILTVWEQTPERGNGHGVFEVMREEAILAQLDPDGLNGKCPPDMDPDEWAQFLAVCERVERDIAEGTIVPPSEDW